MKSFLLDRHNSYLQRWHHSPTAPKENLAEHHFYVARIAYWVAWLVDPRIAERVAVLALFHDEPETQIGDIPGFVKAQIPGAREAVKDWEAWGLERLVEAAPWVLRGELPRLCLAAEDRNTVQGQIVRYADTLAALAYLEDQHAMGNRHPALEALLKALNLQAQECGWPWLQGLRARYPELP